MVAKTPLKEKRLAMALNPNLVRETVNKVDKCMARLQELHFTVTGGSKLVNLSPRSTRGYLKTSLRCKQESLRLKNATPRKSPSGKFQGNLSGGEWRQMSLQAMLLDETVIEILKTSQFAKEIVAKIPNSKPTASNDPKTPVPIKRQSRCENIELRSRRSKEKQSLHHRRRSELASPPGLTRARSRIHFKSNSPLNTKPVILANRVSPKNRPWAKKTVLFPNPLFSSPSSSNPKKFYKTRSPIIARNTSQQKTPHKFLIKTPPTSLRSKMMSKKLVPTPVVFSPVEKKLASVKKTRRCSFSPSKLANRLVSPLRGRISTQMNSSRGLMSGLKQRPSFSTPVKKVPSIKRM
ncbi:microtubule-binding protein TANGLED1 [Asparagus officinalis]|uniref:microtubule-binding protein TANGLED1 n=1 Tax=Asparagus officinalis TaxID=4686 RepID=UPI00098DE607|nr:microtubule-binding protein TANGLED1 [Asparagus officinalis]XP_020276029.1 microtubule-binding protein TANGLED1 [Asparagus officinalis]